jgi:hypothetical protein
VAIAPLKRNFQPPIIDRPLGDNGQLSQSWQAHFEAIAKSLNDDRSLQKTGGTMTGPLILAAAPTVALGAATKAYVDTAAAAALAALTARVVTLESKVATLEAEGATLAASAVMPTMRMRRLTGCLSGTNTETVRSLWSA